MARPCPSCRQDADACSYPGEARPGCLRDKRKREEVNANVGATSIRYSRAKVKLRGLFPDAKSIEIDSERLEVQGLPLLPLPVLADVLKVLTKLWGEDTNITPDFSAEGELLRIQKGETKA